MTTLIPKVLLVDDKEANLFSLESILRDINCEVLKATSGEEGLKLVQKNQFACVLLDVQMPEMDGFEVAARMKSNKKAKDTPILFVTAYEITSDKAKMGYELGALDYLVKPLNPDMIRAKVNVFCELYLKQREIELLKSKT